MKRGLRRVRGFVALCVTVIVTCAISVLADGKVFAPAYFPKVEIPNQQALICFADGREHLVIETSFLGQGTNFAWVVPLPSVPDIKPVSPDLFDSLRATFQPRLIHPVTRYYLGVLFLCGWGFLGWRSLKGEVLWVKDLPLCLLLAAGVWVVSKVFLLGAIVFAALVYVRVFTRSVANLSLGLLVGLGCVALAGFWKSPYELGLIQTMGATKGPESATAQVTVLARQRAGIFDTTTIKGNNAGAVAEWLEQNGFAMPASATNVIRQYVRRGWVFVAAKAQRQGAEQTLSALHPLALTFAASAPVYPLQLTGVDNSECAIDLYVFGDRRAKARHFSVVRCDRVAPSSSNGKHQPWKTWLRAADSVLVEHIGAATVGTKLSGKLTPSQMKNDAEITWSLFSGKGANVYSRPSAITVALNVSVTLAVLGWLGAGACRGGWRVEDHLVRSWRWRLTVVAVAAGFLLFVMLPKVEVVTLNRPAWGNAMDD